MADRTHPTGAETPRTPLEARLRDCARSRQAWDRWDRDDQAIRLLKEAADEISLLMVERDALRAALEGARDFIATIEGVAVPGYILRALNPEGADR